MRFAYAGRAVAGLLFAAGLAGCVDMTLDVTVLSESTARGTMTVAMDRSIYEMSQAQEDAETDFCEDGEVTIEGDKAICVSVEEGTFEEILNDADPDEPQPTITLVEPGLVKVTFPTKTFSEQLGDAGLGEDEETKKMMEAMFAGHNVTLKVSGGEIVDTNMETAEDGMSAALVIPFVDLMNGTAELPDETYAVVKLN